MLAIAVQRRMESATQSPPFLFGLTVGIVLPILTSRVASGVVTGRLGRDRAVVLGVILGIVAFILLRALVALPRDTLALLSDQFSFSGR